MAKLKVDTITAPALWAPALINGDYSSLDTEECRHIAAWVKTNLPGYVVSIANTEEPRFTWSYILYDPLTTCEGGLVLDYVVHHPGRNKFAGRLPLRDDVIGPIQYHSKPNPGGIRFGHGATHYRDFELSECLHPGTRILKSWIVDSWGRRWYR